MPRLIQFIAVFLVLLAARPASAFSLLGPFETWQTPGLGYNPGGGEIGGPKNFGEEYRWNVPVITYGFDGSFVNYFGADGVAAIDAAFAILNSLPDLSKLSQSLVEYPLGDPSTGSFTTYRDSRRVNFRAQADNLLDLKSEALGVIVEELGLASPERWTWALRARTTSTTPPLTNYLTIQRNFDPATYTPSKYVNGNRYTYNVLEFVQPPFADAIEQTVDPEQTVHSFDAVATISGFLFDTGFGPGIFYTYLTRDDIGGLRYIYSTNNLHYEPFPAGTQVFAPDTSSLVLVTNQDLTLFSLSSLSSPPAVLTNLYPGLVINQAVPGISTIVSNFPIVTTQIVTVAFQTNLQTPVIISNIDLGRFSSITLTSAPANLIPNLQAAFPGVPVDQLVIQTTNFFPTTIVSVASVFLTNNTHQPWNDPASTSLILATNYTTNLGILYLYSFRNVITNNFSPLSTFRRIVTGVQKEPWSDPFNPIYKTNVTDKIITFPSGGLIVVPTNLLTYQFTGFNVTNVIGSTNFFFSTNAVDPFSGITRTVSQTDMTLFTNIQFFAYPVEILPQAFTTNIVVTNAFITTNIVTYTYQFANVLTNYSGPTTPASDIKFQVTTNPLSPFLNQTNIISVTPVVLPVASGGFIIDTNLTGFQFTGISNVVVLQETNIVVDVTDPATGIRTVEEIVYNFTNTTYLVFPFVLTNAPASVLRPGVGKLRFQRIGGSFNGNSFSFTNRYQGSYYTNGLLVTNTFVRVQTSPDFLFTAADLGTLVNSVVPVAVTRSANFQNNAALNSTDPTQGGPGTIVPTVNITFNKVGPSIINQFPGFTTEASALGFGGQVFTWGWFDGSTNPPIVFPKEIRLEDIELRMTGGTVP